MFKISLVAFAVYLASAQGAPIHFRRDMFQMGQPGSFQRLRFMANNIFPSTQFTAPGFQHTTVFPDLGFAAEGVQMLGPHGTSNDFSASRYRENTIYVNNKNADAVSSSNRSNTQLSYGA
ncbi:hypothetical protein GGF46_002263 [Coemansia sp. RSA 552]|nr:hypothetical protein GGF46_002263 [Coemansia sp. RSA 552]